MFVARVYVEVATLPGVFPMLLRREREARRGVAKGCFSGMDTESKGRGRNVRGGVAGER